MNTFAKSDEEPLLQTVAFMDRSMDSDQTLHSNMIQIVIEGLGVLTQDLLSGECKKSAQNSTIYF